MNFSTPLSSRRTFLRGVGISLSLPWLESLGGILHASAADQEPRRLLLVCLPLGIFKDSLIPAQAGSDFDLPEYLTPLADFRDRFTVISGLDHPGVGGGHASQSRIFTGVPSSKRNTRSLDQYLAKSIGDNTRFDVLNLNAGSANYSWTDGGTMVPGINRVEDAYTKLFAADTEQDRVNLLREINQGRSLMDFVMDDAKSIQPHLSQRDQEKLEEYFESIRATERRLAKNKDWLDTPKPEVDGPPLRDPEDVSDIISNVRSVLDMSYLAFKTDSTRIVTFGYNRQDAVKIPGVTAGYHNLSHHGMVESSIAQLKIVEGAFFTELNRFMEKLDQAKEGDASLLDRTTIFVTSNLGNGSSHSTNDLPVLLAGGRYRHGQHLAFERSSLPLANLFVSILNQFGLPDDTFATSTGPLRGLDII